MPRLLLACAVIVISAGPASAQYFGQNKVSYETFDFQVLRTAHFDIYHYPAEAEAVGLAARLAEQWRTRLADVLGFDLPGRQPLVLYASQPHFQQTQVIGGLIGEGTGGVTESLKRRMVLPFAGSLGETSHVLGHEMVHAFQYAAAGERFGALPLWFIEGMAEYLSLGPDDAPTAAWLRDLAAGEEIPAIQDLNDPRYFPYRAGHALWAFLASRYGRAIVGSAYLAGARSGDALGAIASAAGEPIEAVSEAWQAAVRTQHAPGAARVPGRRIAGEDDARGRLYVSPALSPDGRWIAYLSERGLFSIDLYVAEAATGRVVRRLTASDTDAHLERLQFVESAGAWDASSSRFAYTTVSGGAAALTLVEMRTDGGSRTMPLPAVDEAWQPTWAPDGRRLAFTGVSGGVTDLYVLDLDGGGMTRLTDDPFADLQPAWSPDGSRLAFITDRFTTSLPALTLGEPRLAVLAAVDRRIEPVSTGLDGPVLNPQWRTDDEVYVVARPDGVPNVYRVALASGAAERVTDVATAVSGITGASPAISYAAGADRLAFSVARGGGYDLYVLDGAGATAGQPAAGRGRARSVMFPEPGRTTAASLGVPGAAGTSVPPLTPAPVVEPYRPALSLDLAAASGGVGVSGRYGATFGGGVGLQFSDMLGDHELGAFLSANGGVRDVGGQVVYLNRRTRWTWGAAALVLPYVSGSLDRGLAVDASGRPLIVDDETLFRQTDMELRGLVAYPFSRASRLEFQGGGRRVAFGREQTRRIYDGVTGDLLDDVRDDLDAPEALTFAEAAAALVFDQAVFGPTGPIRGQRYRFEVAPSLGSLRFTSVTLDYRRYVVPARPFTLAVRALHVARYGGDGEDPRLSALFLGYPSLVRGYDAGTFDSARDCDVVTGTCPEFDALFGSRLLVGNAELRFPLLGVLRRDFRYGPVPIEGFLFGDAGVAWTASSSPSFASGDRDVVRSAGAGVRVNAFGYAIVELAWAKPFDRTRQGWVFGFTLRPGY